MEQEWTEDDDSRDQSVDPENLSGEDDIDEDEAVTNDNIIDEITGENEKNTDVDEGQQRLRRSTRRTKRIFMPSPDPEEIEDIDLDDSGELIVDKGDDQTEWSPEDKAKANKKTGGERRRRKRKGLITMDRRKREKERERRKRHKEDEKHKTKKVNRSRGRPKKHVPTEGEFDTFDEDKTPPKPSTPMYFSKELKEESLPREVKEIIEKVHADMLSKNIEKQDKIEEIKVESPQSATNRPQSVAIFGLEEEEEEESDDNKLEDDDRTLSPPPGEYEENIEAEAFDPDELREDFRDKSIDFDTDYLYPHNNDDEDTQYSVEAELARYAKEDAEIAMKAQQEAMSHERDDYYEEDSDIEQELEQINSVVNDEDVEYYVTYDDNEKEVYYAVSKNTKEDPIGVERPVPPTEFDLESEHNSNHDDIIEKETLNQNMNENVSNNEIEDIQIEGFEYVMNENGEIYQIANSEDIYKESESMDVDDKDVGYSADVEVASPVTSEASTIELTMGQLSIGGEVVEIPDIVLENEGVFQHILSEKTFYSLSEGQQNHLKRFLPRGLDEIEMSKCISSALIHNPNHYFGSPLSKAFNKIRSGYYNIERPTDLHQLQDHRRVWYDHFIRRHYMKLLRQLVLVRQAILEQAATIPDDEPIKINQGKFINTRKIEKEEIIKERAKIRSKMLINYATNANKNDTQSSDESEFEMEIKPIQKVEDAESSVYSLEFTNNDLDLYQPGRIRTVKEMLKSHRLLKKKNPDCPSLDYDRINLEDVFERAGLSFQTERNFLQLCHSNHNQDYNKKKSRKRKRVENTDTVTDEYSNIDDSNDIPC